MSADLGGRGTPLRPSDPRTVGPYQLLSRLGAGGMGVVFLARDAAGELVAVKVVHAELAGDEQFRRRFRSEVHRARQVPPFCTAELLDADPDALRPYLVIEYVDGPSLAEVVEDRGPLSAANLHAVAIGVATALTAIHGAGVIHRDLKPRNVLLAPGSPKVIDFGIARAMAPTSQHSRTDQMVGTVAYMAPERFASASGTPLTPAADVFAWGVVVAYAGTGRTPFGGDSPAATAARILTQPPDLTGLTTTLRDLVQCALAREPLDRPTARDLLDLLLSTGPQREPLAEALDRQPALRTAATDVQAVSQRSGVPADSAGAPVSLSPELAAEGEPPPGSAMPPPAAVQPPPPPPPPHAGMPPLPSSAGLPLPPPVAPPEPPPYRPGTFRARRRGFVPPGARPRRRGRTVALTILAGLVGVGGLIMAAGLVVDLPTAVSGTIVEGEPPDGYSTDAAVLEPLLQDPLDGQGRWPESSGSDGSSCRFVNGMLRVERAGAGHHTCVGPDDPVVPGYQVTVDVKLETTDSCATIGVGRPDGARYRVAVCTGAVKVDRPDRDDATRPVTSLPMAQPLRAEQRTTVEVLVTDEVLEVFRDGHRLGRAVVPEPPEAGPVQLGLQAAPAGQPARSAVSFANVDIRPL